MPVLEVPGARLNYRTAGDGPPLVLVHGSATDMTTWEGVVDELAREHLVVVYDRRGYGQSRHKPVRDHRIHGMRHADRHVLGTALKLKLTQLRGRRLEAAEVFYRFGSALRSGGNSYDLAPENIRRNLQANAEPVLAEWDPHPFGVMHEHIPLRAVAGLTVPLTWILGQELPVDGWPARPCRAATTGHPHRADRRSRAPSPPRPARRLHRSRALSIHTISVSHGIRLSRRTGVPLEAPEGLQHREPMLPTIGERDR